MFQSQHASTSQPNAFAIDSLNQEQKYVPGYLLSTTQGKSVSGFSNFNNPPLLPEPVARDHGQSAPFGTGSLYARPPPKTRDRTAPIVDDDAPPTESLLEGGNFNFSQQHQQAHLQQTLRPAPVSASASNVTKGIAPLQNHEGAVAVIVSGFYPDRAHSVMSQFTAIGESLTPEMSAEGGNWFKITYLNPWDGARALRRDGDIINGDMMVAVRLVDPSQASMLGETTPRLAIATAPAEPTPKSPVIQSSHTTTAFGRAATLAPSASAFRSTAPTTTQVRPAAASAPGADWGVRQQQEGTQENQPQSGVIGKISDMIFGW